MDSSVFSFATIEFDKDSQEIAQLAAKAINGDNVAFGQIYDLYFKKIYKFVYYRVGHKEIAEDLAEDVFIKAHTKLKSLKDPGLFTGWLYQIARNAVIDYYREKSLRLIYKQSKIPWNTTPIL